MHADGCGQLFLTRWFVIIATRRATGACWKPATTFPCRLDYDSLALTQGKPFSTSMFTSSHVALAMLRSRVEACGVSSLPSRHIDAHYSDKLERAMLKYQPGHAVRSTHFMRDSRVCLEKHKSSIRLENPQISKTPNI